MGQRVLYGTLAIAVLLLLFVLDVSIAEASEELEGALGQLLQRGSVLPVVFLVVMLCASVELNRLLRAKAAHPHALFGHLMIALLLLTPWLSAAGWLGASPAEVEGLHWQIVWLMVAGIGTAALAVLRGRPEGTLHDVGATFICVFYLGFLSSFALQLRCGRDIPGHEGAWLLLIVILVTKASDIGAYLVGSTIGRHKLARLISPAKTIEGAVGGLLTGAVVAVLLASADSLAAVAPLGKDARDMIAEVTRSFSFQHVPGGVSPHLRAAFFGLAVSAAGQFGDLVESCFKRDAGTKDSGRLLPRFGGILDLIDSVVLAVPVAWLLLTVVWNVV